MSKMDSLQNALNTSSGRTQAPPPSVAPKAAPRTPASPSRDVRAVQSGREGKENIGVWLPVGFKKSIRLVQAKNDMPLQDILAEALNDLFVKYNVPTVSE